MKLAAVILSAGASRRNGGQAKALIPIEGQPQLIRLAGQLAEAGFSPLWAITGAHHGLLVEHVGRCPLLRLVENSRWQEGMGSSVQLGLDLAEQGPDLGGVLLTPVDLLGSTSADWQALRTAFLARPHIVATATEPDGLAGTPIVVARTHFSSLRREVRGDSGARAWLRSPGRPVHLCALPNLARDTDTLADRQPAS